MIESDIFSSPFDIIRHKSSPYHIPLEVMIAPDGTIEYANPSHQEFLIAKAAQRNNLSRDELMAACPPEFYANFMDWLIPQSGGYIPVWEIGILHYPLTKAQIFALRKLKLAGLYRGYVPSLVSCQSF